MSYLPLNLSAVTQASTSHPSNTPIFMLNLFRYRPTAKYSPSHAHLAPATPCTGEEAMTAYRTKIRAVIPPNTTIHFSGVPIVNVVAPEDEKWDLMVLVRYESLEAFKEMVESREYREEVMPHRIAGLEDARLIMMSEDGDA